MSPQAPLEWIEPPRGRFFADPFLCDGELFFEDYNGTRGHIARWDGRKSVPVLTTPFHLSYPCLVRAHGERFMIPEQHESGRVDLYRAHDWPHDWRVEATLLSNLAGVDPTLHYHQGCWWMFVADQHDQPRHQVFLYQAPALTGPWRRHGSLRAELKARPGGALIAHGDKLLRPAQNRTRTYGGSLVLWEIESWSREEYKEREWARWEPLGSWPYPDGLHHVCCADGVTVFDAKKIVEVL